MTLTLCAEAQWPYVVQALNISVLDGSASAANSRGQVVGYHFDEELDAHAIPTLAGFFYSPGNAEEVKFQKRPTTMVGVNDSSEAVGTGTVKVNGRVTNHAFSYNYKKGTFRDLTVATSGRLVSATGINNRGQVVGGLKTAGSAPNRAGVLTNGRLVPLQVPAEFVGLWTVGINNAGQVAGTLHDSANKYTAFRSQGGVVNPLGTTGTFTGSRAYGIGPKGEVAGSLLGSGQPSHAFVWKDGTMTDLGTLQADATAKSIATGVDGRGRVVGSSQAGYDTRGVVWIGGVAQDLNALVDPTLGATIRRAIAVNEVGVITATNGAFFSTDDGTGRLFLLWPRKEGAPPATLQFTGKRRVTTRARIDLTGMAKNAVSVTFKNSRYSAGTSFADGARIWKLHSLLLRKGANVITIIAHGQGGDSKPLKVTVVRQ